MSKNFIDYQAVIKERFFFLLFSLFLIFRILNFALPLKEMYRDGGTIKNKK